MVTSQQSKIAAQGTVLKIVVKKMGMVKNDEGGNDLQLLQVQQLDKLSAIMDRVEKLESENNQLKKKVQKLEKIQIKQQSEHFVLKRT